MPHRVCQWALSGAGVLKNAQLAGPHVFSTAPGLGRRVSDMADARAVGWFFRFWRSAANQPAGVGFLSLDSDVLEGTSFSEQADCVVYLHSWINERWFVVRAERRNP